MEVSGTVLDASNLEPIKGILVGLHANLNDSAFTKLPFDRVGTYRQPWAFLYSWGSSRQVSYLWLDGFRSEPLLSLRR